MMTLGSNELFIKHFDHQQLHEAENRGRFTEPQPAYTILMLQRAQELEPIEDAAFDEVLAEPEDDIGVFDVVVAEA